MIAIPWEELQEYASEAWWLTLVDGVLPIGDLLFYLGLGATAVGIMDSSVQIGKTASIKYSEQEKDENAPKPVPTPAPPSGEGEKNKVGENGTKVPGSKTTGKNGKTERVDVENPAPGERDGDLHYHDSNNTKWRYDIKSNQFIDPKNGRPAPTKIQKILEDPWIKKAIDKGLKILGEK